MSHPSTTPSLLALTIHHLVTSLQHTHQQHHEWNTTLRTLPYDLRELIISTLMSAGELTPQLLITLASTDLQHLDLSPITTVSSVYQKHPRNVWEETVCAILDTCGRHLIHLNLSYHRFTISTSTLLTHHILPHCHQLTHLILHASSGITSHHIHAIMITLSHLIVLIITGDRKLKWPEEEWGITPTDDEKQQHSIISPLPSPSSQSTYPSLHHLDLSGCTSILHQQSLLFTCTAWINSTIHLDLSAITMTSLDPSIACLSHCQTLILKGNRLHTLPDAISSLSHLTHLDLSGNLFSTFPTSISTLPLTWLSLRANRLMSLSHEIGEMITLKHLDCSFNALRTLPLSLHQLTELEMLDLDYNYISMPPDPASASASTSTVAPISSTRPHIRAHHPAIPAHLVASACRNNSELEEEEQQQIQDPSQQSQQPISSYIKRGILKISYNG